MRRFTILLAFAVLESWPASIIVGPGRTYQTVKSAILGSLPLDDNLNIYVEMPTGTYTVQETITPDASWNGKSVKVTGLKWVPDITGYMGNDVVLEWNGDEVLPTTYNYLGLGGSVEGSVTPSGSRRSYFKDHLGSTRMTVGDAGQILEASIFSAYGKEYWVVQTSGEQTREKFTGKEFDTEGTNGAELGVHLNYFGARYYDPDIGTWISPDPARQYHSPYLYAGNGLNPVNFTDANGLLLGPKAEADWQREVCSDVPFGGSMSLANDWEEMRNIPGQTFDYEIDATLVTAETYSTNDIRLPAGLSNFESLRLFAHEASHVTILSYRENYEALGWRSTKAPWHDDMAVHKAKGGLWGLMEWNSTLPRVKDASGYNVWDPFYARDRIYYNEAGIGP